MPSTNSYTFTAASELEKVKLQVAAKLCGAQYSVSLAGAGSSTSVASSSAPSQKVEYLNPALRFLIQTAYGDAKLGVYGETQQQQAQIDSWLEFAESECDSRSKTALLNLLKEVLEPHLKTRTFLVTEFLTL